MNSLASYLSINSHVFPRISNMSGGAFICTCPTDGQPDKYGKICDCMENIAKQTATNINVNDNVTGTNATVNDSDAVVNVDVGVDTNATGNDIYDTYTEPTETTANSSEE